MLRSKSFLYFLFFFSCTEVNNQDAEKNLKPIYFSPAIVNLDGVIKKDTYFGAPGFGETPDIDTRDTVYYIELKKSINIFPDPAYKYGDGDNVDTLKNIFKIQIVKPSNKELRKYLDKPVAVEGVLEHAVTGTQHGAIHFDSPKCDALTSNRQFFKF